MTNLDDDSHLFDYKPSAPRENKINHILIGRPLATADAAHETIGKVIGLAVFASDALSSTAYATQEILFILAAAGTGAFGLAFPISMAIAILMAIVAFSYEQTIHAYPSGGGAYVVARDNLGEIPAQVASAALLSDYVLTVAVSISSGVAQITSAFPVLFDYRVLIGVGFVFLVMLINLRGVRESGTAFAIPTYFFVITMFITMGIGLVRYVTGSLGSVVNPPEMLETTLVAVTPFLILHAFSSGTAALTGIEAISNGITAFKEPRSRNAGITLVYMTLILGSLFLSVSFLAGHIHAIPAESETVISQLARTIYGGQGLPYLAVIVGTAIILILAANTAFNGFPRLGAIQASDGYLPRQLTYRGSRLVYSQGIVALAVLASILIVIFQASVTRLIPLYAIGVFLSFTLSQFGMARRWWKSGHMNPHQVEESHGRSVLQYDRAWLIKMMINGFGALLTAIVMVVFAVTKFKDGAWVVIIVIPVLVTIFLLIHRHYQRVAEQLSLNNPRSPVGITHNRVIIPISGVHQGILDALRYARTLSDDITAVHVSIDPVESEKVQEKWEIWGQGHRLVTIASPYRLFYEPLLDYITRIEAATQEREIITIVVPHFVPRRAWTNFLHARTAETLRKLLIKREHIVVIEVPYQVD